MQFHALSFLIQSMDAQIKVAQQFLKGGRRRNLDGRLQPAAKFPEKTRCMGKVERHRLERPQKDVISVIRSFPFSRRGKSGARISRRRLPLSGLKVGAWML